MSESIAASVPPRWRLAFDAVSGWSAVLLIMAAPFSRSLFLLASVVFVASWFGSQAATHAWRDLKELPATAPLLLLAAIVALWAWWSPAPSGDVINNLKVYCKLLMVLQLVVTLRDPVWQDRAWKGFAAGMLLVVASTWLNVVVDLPWSRTAAQGIGQDHSVFVEYVSQSVMSALFLGACIHWGWAARSVGLRALWLVVGLMTLLSVMLLLQGRSGWLACACVLVTATLLKTPARFRYWAMGGGLLALAGLVAVSPLAQARLLGAYNDLVNYIPMANTSLGGRIDMWRLAWETFLAHPWVGAGSGMYHSMAATHFGHCEMTCTHPHNLYLFFAMEYGLPGLLAWLWLLWRIGQTAWRSVQPRREMLFFWLAIVVVDSLYNVPLWYRAQSYFFYAMLGLCLASCLAPRAQQAQALAGRTA